jgi:hypothetical protein
MTDHFPRTVILKLTDKDYQHLRNIAKKRNLTLTGILRELIQLAATGKTEASPYQRKPFGA